MADCIRARPSAETKVHVDCYAALSLSLGPVQGKRRILRRLSRPVLRTEARAPAIKTPFAEKREIQWKRNGHEWMTERRGRAARESGKGEKKSKGENDRKIARERERDCLASALLQLAAVVYQRCRGAISFALSRMSEQKAHFKLDPSCFLHLLCFVLHLRPLRPAFSFSFYLSACRLLSSDWYSRSMSCQIVDHNQSEIKIPNSTTSPDLRQLIKISNL